MIICLQFPFTFCFETGEISMKLLRSQKGKTYAKLTITEGVLLKVNANQGTVRNTPDSKFTTSVNVG